MAQRVAIPDDCVYEGYGNLYRGDAEVTPPQPIVGARGGNGVFYGTIDSEEALRQLRTALRVDVHPQLKALVQEKKLEEVAPSPAILPWLVCRPNAPQLRTLPSSFSPGTRYEIERMKSQCRFLRDWLMCHETPEERVEAREFLRTAQRLLQKESVEELLGRTENLLQQLENWPAVVEKARPHIAEWNNDKSLTELREFVGDVLGTDEVCARLSKLTCRFSLLAPLLEEAAFRSAALEEMEQWSSEATVSSLRSLRASIQDWEVRVAKDQQNVLDSSQLLLERIATVRNKRRESAGDLT
ncbi:RNA helicase [Trypanosoma cruzi]|nr:RNA helicase [Trypanosoma cruzi]